MCLYIITLKPRRSKPPMRHNYTYDVEIIVIQILISGLYSFMWDCNVFLERIT